MLLVLDVGNTNTGVGLYDGDQLIHSWRIRSDREKTSDEHGILLTQLLAHRGVSADAVAGIAVACVLPPLLPILEQMSQDYFGTKPLFVGPEVETGLVIRYEQPRDVGADRIANAVAAKAKYPLPAIIVDFSTATTFDCISAAGEYLGGAIAPGIGVSLEALFERASKLPRVPLVDPGSPIGTNTTMSIQAGIVYGTAGEVDTIVSAIAKEMKERPTVIATGGVSRAIAPQCRTIDVVDEMLTLEGIRRIYLMNLPPGHA